MHNRKCVHCVQDDEGNTQICKKGCSEIKLFGVQISVPSDDDGAAMSSSIRKCKSMDNLEACIAASAAEEPSGYLSDGFVHQYSKSHERKRGKPWSEEEHLSFLEGLEKLGKGDWKGIASKFVPSRKSSQVASHAQKYFNRLNLTASNKKRRRGSVFDIPPTHTTANQQSQGSQSNNIGEKGFHIGSSSAAAPKNIGEHKVMPHVTTSERPPLSPMQPSWLPDFHGLIYLQPRALGSTKWYPAPNSPWAQVVYLPSQSASFGPNNFPTSRQGLFQAAPSPSGRIIKN